MDLLMGLDVGTTATKAALFDLEGKPVASASSGYGLITPHEGWVEQDPEALWQAVLAASRSVMARIDGDDRVVALAQSSQAGTTIPVDEHGVPTYQAISWMDHRGGEYARRTEERWGREFIYETTGWPLQSGLPLQHIAWLKGNRPDAFARTRRFLFVNDFVSYRLTGELSMNPSDASITQLLNITTGDWDDRLLDTAGITRDQVSPVRPSGGPLGRPAPRVCQATGLPPSLLVVSGAHDQYCAAVGTGVTRPGSVLLSSGTAWVILAVPQDLRTGLASGMAISCHAVPGVWGAIRSLGGVGTSLEWFLENLWRAPNQELQREALYVALNQAVACSPAGARGLLFYPLAGGHRSAITAGGGGFVGLTLAHSRDDMARAVLEGIALQLRWAMEDMRDHAIHVDRLTMVGGAAESPVWPQIVADATGIPVSLPAHRQAACRGAAILAGVGAALFASVQAGCDAFRGPTMERCPDRGLRGEYDALFAVYTRVGRSVIDRLTA